MTPKNVKASHPRRPRRKLHSVTWRGKRPQSLASLPPIAHRDARRFLLEALFACLLAPPPRPFRAPVGDVGAQPLAVLAGYVAMAVSTIAMFVVLGAVIPGAFESYATGKAQPSNGVLLVILTFGVLSAVLGGYVTASLAKSSPMDHVYALAGFVVVLGLWSAFYEGESAPLWYRLALAVIGGAGVVVGGTMTVTEPPEYARLD
eukprot:CAMPEP_0170167658 /NCGR_PEP_ID=MMETSP0040_2-20121228/1000_1 /TAXON_ID=641309 /ORGANISM="Lotharella oceanica, Strain CCMP622" /LENGTH=203 /DNA_ID=CAMNT_0010405751 /DNA_START=355 /DNA_END=967 /DNA_ORIENTATION=+